MRISKAKAGLAVLGLASAIAFAGPAFAQDARFYVGGALGQSSVDVDCTGTTSCDNEDSSWKILVGYQFNRNFALEFGYADLGAASATTPPFVFPPFGTIPGANLQIEATTWELVGVGSVPIAERFSIYGKLGLYRADTETSVSFTDGTSGSQSDSNTGLTFGLGLRYDFTRNLGVRAEWQRYGDVSEAASGEEFDIDVISIGVIFRF
jgi:OmpA-OmpF porin, OOP family